MRHRRRGHNQQQLTENLNNISNFLQANQLTVNQAKTQVLETMLPQKRCKIQGNNPILAVLDENKEVKMIKAEDSIRLLGMKPGEKPHLGSPPQLWGETITEHHPSEVRGPEPAEKGTAKVLQVDPSQWPSDLQTAVHGTCLGQSASQEYQENTNNPKCRSKVRNWTEKKHFDSQTND